MTKSILSEYIDACKLVEETEKDLERLKDYLKDNSVDIVKGSNPNFPYEQRNFRIEGIDYKYVKNDDVRKLEQILSDRRDLAREKRLAVEYWMNTVPVRIARIIRMKYFGRQSWARVSFQLGYTSPDAARMELNRYMASQGETKQSEKDEKI